MPHSFRLDERHRRMIRLVPLGLAAAVLVGFVLTAFRVDSVQPSEIGVVVNNLTGKIDVRLQAGSFFYNGLWSDVHKLDKSVKTLVMRERDGQAVNIKTRDGSNVTLDVEVNYSILTNEKELRERLLVESGVGREAVWEERRGRRGVERVVAGSEEAWQAKWIREYSRAVIRYVFGELATKEWYDARERDAKTRKARDELDARLREHGLQVVKVIPDRFRFYPEYEKKIQEKKDADQEYENQVEQAKTQERIQERRQVEIEKEKEVQIAKTKGELERELIETEGQAIKLRKEAEAYAIRTRIEADATIYKAEREAKGVLAAARAEAEGLENLVTALEGEGGRNLVLRAIAERLSKARIEGLPYATSPVIQKVSVEDAAAAARTGKEGR
ncbi:MAG: SPFH domain-containing protein [Planctomycetota bacterium]